MIRLENVGKHYHVAGLPPKSVLDSVSIEFPTRHNTGVLGLNGAGKSTLIRLLAGSEQPDKGRIIRSGMVSFPLGFSSIFHPDLTARENISFVSRVYDLNISEVIDYVVWFSEIGDYFNAPVKFYSSGMLAKLAFGLCLAIDFDVYLIDEITEVGDGVFREKAAQVFRERAARSDIILVSHNIDTIREYCDMAAVIHDGQIRMFDDVEEAFAAFRILNHRMNMAERKLEGRNQ
tara:strand:+ start:5821 stop:6519 length:699 start_codon:yes stop_codon:yes gene_type:complete